MEALAAEAHVIRTTMRLIACPDCNRQISFRASTCPGCGLADPGTVSAQEQAFVANQTRRRIRVRALVESVVLLIPVLIATLWVAGFLPEEHKPKAGFVFLYSIPTICIWRYIATARKARNSEAT